ncbi:MAG: hypothetical protein JSW54_07710 [Fidelibacterota bacterium]|nr:MAG: hypothetical protein JSW54_07710 [Candidatus Neomarinimicrobiota bacterium]
MSRVLILLVIIVSHVSGQLIPERFSLHKTLGDTSLSYYNDSTSSAGLASNSIIDIRMAGDSILFFGTSRGLSLTPDLGNTFRSYIADVVDLPEGGISALDLNGSLVAVASLVDTMIGQVGEVKGGGMSFSTDTGNTWIWEPQSTEDLGDSAFTTFQWADGHTIRQLAVTTTIRNVTYDVAATPGVIWTTSWAGGLRRYEISSGQWTPVPLPRDDDTTFTCEDIPADYELNSRDPIDGGNHNHKAFSVVAYDSVIWVGTAAGVNRGIIDTTTGCISWTHFKAQWGVRTISGNWVVALHRQTLSSGRDRIWAATVHAEDASEVMGVSFTEDDGVTWYVSLRGERAHNITSSGEAVYVATDNGLYKSFDGLNWARFKTATDNITGEEVWAEQAYGAAFDTRDSTLWIGTPDGLARTQDHGVTWDIERSYVSTASSGEDRFYVYPNPFYLAEDNYRDGRGHVRFQYHLTGSEVPITAKISIYDFAMDPVIVLSRPHSSSGDFSQVWDGRNEAGYQVANGVYYCRLRLGLLERWTKVMVIK